jgi:hypothetical protein
MMMRRRWGFGLIAEEVEKVNSALVYRNDKGHVESVRYEMVNAMQSRLAQQEHQIEGLSAGLQKVNAQLEMNRSAPQVAATGQ